MSDNIPVDLCERKMKAHLDIPCEVWTDVFKLLPRRILVQHVQPVNKVFKAICDRNVKNVHVIDNAIDLLRKLYKNDPEACRQLGHLAANNCQLAGQFRLTHFPIYDDGKGEAKQLILRHCPDLFRGCQLCVSTEYVHVLVGPLEVQDAHFVAYLTLLESTKPVYVDFDLESEVKPNLDALFQHPTTMNTNRLKLRGNFQAWANRQAIFDWIHHKPMAVVDDMDNGEGQEVGGGDGELRALILFEFWDDNSELFIEWLLERCLQNFQQSQGPEDRRHFALTIQNDRGIFDDFHRVENPATGEVLLLEPVMYDGDGRDPDESDSDDDEKPVGYRLLRCMATSQVVNNGTEQFYAKLFKSDEMDMEFNVEDGQGKEPPVVVVRIEEFGVFG